jgi:hypothetical protein
MSQKKFFPLSPPESKEGLPANPSGDQLFRTVQALRMSTQKNALSDFLTTLRQAKPIRALQSILRYLRRIRLVALLFRILGWLLTLLQTGALVIFTTAIFFVLLPIFLVFSVGLLLAALINTRQSRARLLSLTQGKRLYLFFSPQGAVGIRTIQELEARDDVAVLVISPYWISCEGLGRKGFYVNMRCFGNRLFLIRRYFFLSVRSRLPKDTVWIY